MHTSCSAHIMLYVYVYVYVYISGVDHLVLNNYLMCSSLGKIFSSTLSIYSLPVVLCLCLKPHNLPFLLVSMPIGAIFAQVMFRWHVCETSWVQFLTSLQVNKCRGPGLLFKCCGSELGSSWLQALSQLSSLYSSEAWTLHEPKPMLSEQKHRLSSHTNFMRNMLLPLTAVAPSSKPQFPYLEWKPWATLLGHCKD